MSLERLTDEASNLPEYCAANIIAFYDTLADQGPQANPSITSLCEWVKIPKNAIPTLFKTHCSELVKFLEELSAAMADVLKENRDVIFYVMGSLAKLEFVDGVSDVDILGVCTRPAASLRNGGKQDPQVFRRVMEHRGRLEAIERGLKRKLGQSKLKRTVKEKRSSITNVEVYGLPYYGGRYFFTKKELLKQLGKFNEPGWAVFHRGSLVFESAYFAYDGRREKLAREIRSEANNIYYITAHLRNSHYPVLGALLMKYLTKSGVIANVAKLAGPKLHDAESLIERKPDAEILKTIVGRIWASVIHMISLHVLYWAGQLISTESECLKPERIQAYLSCSPMQKILHEVPTLYRAILKEKGYLVGTAFEEKISDRPAGRLETLLREIYGALTPLGFYRQTGGTTELIPPMYVSYISLFIVSKLARQNQTKIAPGTEKILETICADIFHCLSVCEELTLLLTATGPNDGGSYLRLFGGEIFDKTMYSQMLYDSTKEVTATTT